MKMYAIMAKIINIIRSQRTKVKKIVVITIEIMNAPTKVFNFNPFPTSFPKKNAIAKIITQQYKNGIYNRKIHGKRNPMNELSVKITKNTNNNIV
jgi:hypothetical protein